MAREYRADIDGLRTVAVIPVVIFHLGTALFSGGFVGVDVFFVISGFLITQTLLDERGTVAQGLLDFYKRRVRRIFPALFVLYLAVMAAAAALLMSDQATEVSNSILASIFFVSNILFYGQSDYFDGALDSNPLLHTWSLSVEEQFYVFFPLLIFFTRSLADSRRRQIIWAITVASFLASVWMVYRDPSAAFYLIPFRTWELAIGALLALGAIPGPRRQWQAEAGAVLGLAMIGYAVLFYNKATLFPGLSALLPCVGAGLVILCGNGWKTLAGRALALWPMRFVGLISYSLYLWHWPIIVFYKHLDARLDNVERAGLLAASLVAAAISWKFIEQPFRHTPGLSSRQVVLRGTGAMAACAAAVFALAMVTSYAYPISAQARGVLAYGERTGRTAMMRTGTCFLTTQDTFDQFRPDECLGAGAGKPRVLIIGDSHAAHLYYGLHAALPTMQVLQATASGCKPLLSTRGAPQCLTLMDHVFNDYIPKLRPDVVIVSARWLDGDVPRVAETVAKIRQTVPRVLVSGPIVEYDQPLPRLLAMQIDQGEPIDRHRNAQVPGIDTRLAAAMKAAGVPYFSMYHAVCAPNCALWAQPGVPVQFDYGHLTQQGSIMVARQMVPDIAQLAGQSSVAVAGPVQQRR